MGLDVADATDSELAKVFSGQALPERASPIALAYAGPQFGHFSPQLGDGRALLLGEIVAPDGARVEVDLTEASRGLKNFAVAMFAVAYLFVREPRRNWVSLSIYAATFVSLFLVSAFVLPTFNRYLIMGTIVVLANEWAVSRQDEESDIFDRGFVVVTASAIVLPYVIGVPDLFYSGTW